jgi:cytochrome c553
MVHFSLLTGRDEAEVTSILENAKKLNREVEASITTRLMQSIVSINGEQDRAKLAPMIQNMRASDARALRNYIESIEPGVDMKQKTTCPHCAAQSEVNMPLGVTFFWPDAGKS